MPTVTLTWICTFRNSCETCKALHGYQWIIDTKDQFPSVLTHPIYGAVWDTRQGSSAHGCYGKNCQCHIDVMWEFGDLLQRVQAIRERLEAALTEGENMDEMAMP